MSEAVAADREQANALVARLEALEVRLKAALAGGTRGLVGWADGLRSEADDLDRVGLGTLAARLRALLDVREPLATLGALTMALRTSEQLRLRLTADAVPGEGSAPLGPGREGRAADRLVPVGRVTVGGQRLWACARLRSRYPEDLVLLEPVAIPSGVQPWLAASHLLLGHLRWLERSALGSGTLNRFILEDPVWEPARGAKDDPVGHFREQLATSKVADGTVVTHSAWPLHLLKLKPDARDKYVWLDPSLEAALFSPTGFAQGTWVIAWTQGAQHVPLALFAPHGLIRKEMHVVHADGGRDKFAT